MHWAVLEGHVACVPTDRGPGARTLRAGMAVMEWDNPKFVGFPFLSCLVSAGQREPEVLLSQLSGVFERLW